MRTSSRRAIFALFGLCLGLSAWPARAFDLNQLNSVMRHADTAIAGGEALRKGTQEITPEQEHYIGRAVAAQIMARAAEIMPGWTPAGAPQRTTSALPVGTLTYVNGTFSRADAPPPAPLPAINTSPPSLFHRV